MRRDGTASWRGEAWVDRIGAFTGAIEPDEFDLLASFIERCALFDWNDEYRPAYEISDGPGYDLGVTRGRRTKIVHQYLSDEPADFWVIATLVDALTATVASRPALAVGEALLCSHQHGRKSRHAREDALDKLTLKSRLETRADRSHEVVPGTTRSA